MTPPLSASRFSLLAVSFVVWCGCRTPPPVPLDAGVAPVGEVPRRGLAIVSRQTMSKRARCEIPNGGARVLVFDSFTTFPADCELQPWGCGSPRSRDTVLRALDAGNPHEAVHTDADGRFEVSMDERGLVVVECADQTLFHAPSGMDQSFTDPTIELKPEPAVEETTPFIHPNESPDGPLTLAVRLEPATGVVPREASVQLVREDGGMTSWVQTRSSGVDFRVAPGRYTARVRMPGATAKPVTLDAPASGARALLRLEPGLFGRVVNAESRPVAGAIVTIDDQDVRSDAEGEFAWMDDDSKPDGGHRVRARHPGVGESEELISSRGPVLLTLISRSDTRVHLDGADGGAVWGFAQLFEAPETPPRGRFTTVPIRDSELVLNGLASGHFEVLVLTREWSALQLSLEVGSTPQRLTRRLAEKSTAEGVLISGSAPVPNARVRFTNPPAVFGYQEDETHTDAQGHFRIGRSLPGEASMDLGGQHFKVKFPSKVLRLNLR